MNKVLVMVGSNCKTPTEDYSQHLQAVCSIDAQEIADTKLRLMLQLRKQGKYPLPHTYCVTRPYPIDYSRYEIYRVENLG